MPDFTPIAPPDRRFVSSIYMALVVVLLLAAMAWVSGESVVGRAVAQSRAEKPLDPAQRRLLKARLDERFTGLLNEVEYGKQLAHTALKEWKRDAPSPSVALIFNGDVPARPFANGTKNPYEAAIKQYVTFMLKDDPKAWNPWPKKGDVGNQTDAALTKRQRNYASCVLKRVDRFFELQKDYIRLVEGAVEPETPDAAASSDVLGEAIERALRFNGGIKSYLGSRYFFTTLAIPNKRPNAEEDIDAIRDDELDLRVKCPTAEHKQEGVETATHTEPLSIEWSPKCLQSDEVRSDGTAEPYHPTTAALMFDNGRTAPSAYCSGTLIAPNAVLTAAHCVCETAAKVAGGQFYRTAADCASGGYARLGRWVSTLDPSHQTVFLQHAGHFDIARIVLHPQFRWTDELPFSDLAILFLKSPVPAIPPVPLNTLTRLPVYTKAAAVGYGAHNPIGASGAVTTTATVVEMTGLKLQANIATGVCTPFQRARKLICWRYQSTDRFGMRLGSTCRGDSGGPLYAGSGGQTYLVGVTSAGGPSCLPTSSAFDTEVYPHKEWILGQLAMTPPVGGASPRGGNGMRQVRCHFCSHCKLEASFKVPEGARHVRISVNCTPDEITRQSHLDLKVSEYDPTAAGNEPNLCPSTPGQVSTALSCPVAAKPNQELTIKLTSGLLQQCQVVATAFD